MLDSSQVPRGCVDESRRIFFPEKRTGKVLTREVRVGDRFGRWLITGESTKRKRYYAALCECGTERDIFKQQLIRGNSLSCGCLCAEMTRERLRGKASPWKGRSASPETRALIGEKVKAAWERGVHETPAVAASREKLKLVNIGIPETGVNAAGPGNKKAKFYRLRSPDGIVLEGFNLMHLVRENRDLFEPKDVRFLQCRTGVEGRCNAYTNLVKVGAGTRPSWKGWTSLSLAASREEVAAPA